MTTVDVYQFLIKPLSEYRQYSVEVIRPAFNRIYDPHLFLIYEHNTLVAECTAYIKGIKLLPKNKLTFIYTNKDKMPHESLLNVRDITVYEFTKLCKPSKIVQTLSSSVSINDLYENEKLINGHTSLIDRIAFYSTAIMVCGDNWSDHEYFYTKLMKAQSDLENIKREQKGYNENYKNC